MLPILLGLGSPFIASPALAGSSATAAEVPVDEWYRGGVEMRRRGDDRGALHEFQKSYQAKPAARTLAQIGFAEQALGRWVDAEAHLTEAMKSSADPWIVKNREALEQALAVVVGHLGTVVVESSVKGAALDMNGAPVGSLPLDRPLRVTAGTVVLGVRASGYFPVQRIATVAAGELAREQIDLVPLSASPPPPADMSPAHTNRASNAQPALPPRAVPAVNDAPDESRRVVPSNHASTLHSLAWVGAGLTGAALATGVTFQLIRQSRSTSYNRTDAGGMHVCNRDAAGHFFGPADCADAYNGAATAKTFMIVGYAGAVVFGAATAALFVVSSPVTVAPAPTDGKQARRSWNTALACGPGVGTWSLACDGSF